MHHSPRVRPDPSTIAFSFPSSPTSYSEHTSSSIPTPAPGLSLPNPYLTTNPCPTYLPAIPTPPGPGPIGVKPAPAPLHYRPTYLPSPPTQVGPRPHAPSFDIALVLRSLSSLALRAVQPNPQISEHPCLRLITYLLHATQRNAARHAGRPEQVDPPPGGTLTRRSQAPRHALRPGRTYATHVPHLITYLSTRVAQSAPLRRCPALV